MTRVAVLPGLDAAGYRCNTLHADHRTWIEKNCYVDIWIELLHALDLNPLAMLPFALGIDFAGDQWTFFKPPHDELRDLYGIDVQELYVWRPLLDHALEHLGAGRLISTEADSFWLPDTAGTDYRRNHVKTTIVMAGVDVDAARLGYFHNTGYHVLEGEDFRQTFRLAGATDPACMPLFAELVRIDRVVRRTESELAALSSRLLRRHLSWLPSGNPIGAFRGRFDDTLADIQTRGLPAYHAWAFGTIRQLGAATELASAHLQWLAGLQRVDLQVATAALESISMSCKGLILKAARAVNARKPLDAGAIFDAMEQAWSTAISELHARYPGPP